MPVFARCDKSLDVLYLINTARDVECCLQFVVVSWENIGVRLWLLSSTVTKYICNTADPFVGSWDVRQCKKTYSDGRAMVKWDVNCADK